MKPGNPKICLMRTALLVCGVVITNAWAHDSAWVIGGAGTAAVDGIQSPGEWDGALSVTFNANLPVHDGGGTTPVTLFAMNDAANLYVALQVQRSSVGLATNPGLFFDANHDGVRDLGDDGIGMSVGIFQAPDFFDTYVVDAAGNTVDDLTGGGSVDGAAAATSDGTYVFIEMSHPLDSLDDAHDFSVMPGQIIGFGGLMNLFSLDTSCTPNEIGSDCQAFTNFAGTFTQPVGDLILLSPTPGSCETAATEARRIFVESCLAAGGSRASCNMAGNDILLSALEHCRTP